MRSRCQGALLVSSNHEDKEFYLLELVESGCEELGRGGELSVIRDSAHALRGFESTDNDLCVIPLRHPGRWVAAAILVVTFLGTTWSFAKNPNVGWHVVGHYLFNSLILNGTMVTLCLTAIAMLVGVVGGTIMATMRLSPNPIVSTFAKSYIWFFRGTPILIQIIFWGYFGAIYPSIKLGIPFTHVTFVTMNSGSVMTPMMAAILSLGLNEIAYSAEIVRGGIMGVSPGQTEAAYSLGITPTTTTRRIVLPQAMRIIVPPMGNEFLTMLKETALVSVISGRDLMTATQQIYSQTYQVIPLLVVASIWYLAMTSLLSIPQRWLERRFGRARPAQMGTSGIRRVFFGGVGGHG